ncbi:DUF1285 domain-containing protein [Thalassolituus oleivorans]|uniref:DUF1285 domain-containing protein n=1 Tax=Thalassolituus oleivorans TaxID=187493 RepID=UPI00042DD11B|nr:DUF1285 domain-containing protein [Thalassolituus oleivorans]AHK15850.1 hypothetical protein R615_08775 [Thalassolituus oleivorans R6-15]APR67138.1 hypothetical protein CN03_09455 [Thalassolituus oleivorans]
MAERALIVTLDELAHQLGIKATSSKLPPVMSWNPELSGDMDMVIRKDGTWWHEGVKIERKKLVQVFSTILRKEGDDYFLLTPVEKWRIRVEDLPFVVDMIERDQGGLFAALNIDGVVEITTDNFALSELDGLMIPMIHIRDGLWARFSRNAYYQLIEECDAIEDATPEVSVRGGLVSLG